MKLLPHVKSGPAWFIMVAVMLQLAPKAESFSLPHRLEPPPATDCNSKCKGWKELRRSVYTEIDANTGAFIGGRLDYDSDQQPQIIFKNKNPFKYSYRYEIKNEPTAGTIASDFLGLIPGFGDILAAAKGQAITPPTTSSGASLSGTNCSPTATASWKSLQSEAAPISTTGKTIKNDLEQKSKDLETKARPAYDKFLSTVEKGINENSCINACTEAETTRTTLEDFKPGDLPDRIKTHKETVKGLDKLIEKFEADASPQCKTEKQAELDIIKQLKPDADKYEEASKKLQDSKKTFDQLVKIINAALASEDAFVEIIEVPVGRGARTVKVRIFRQDLLTAGAKEVEVTALPIEITVGESPISLSAGIGFSSISDRKVVRQAANVPNPDGGTKLGAIFGFEQNSSFKPSGVVMLNASLPKRFNFFGKKSGSLAASSGLVVSNRNGDTEVEFILGPSIGFLDNHVFATFGFHAAKVEKLSGNFEIGQEVPADLQDPIPVERSWQKGFMFSLTFKIR
jgi:hypothetical protein